MDLLSHLTGIAKSSQGTISNEPTSTTASSGHEQDVSMEESDSNKTADLSTTKLGVTCKVEEQQSKESGDLPKNGIVESFMLKMAPDSGVQIFRSKKGFEKLAYEGYLYNLDKRHQKYVLWRCEMSKKPGYKCSGRVRMTENSLDMYSAHSHPPNPLKVVADILKARLYAAAEDPTNSSKFLYHEAVHLASFAGSSGLPKLGSMQRVISRKRRHTQKLLEERLSPSNYDLSNLPSTSSASADTNCSIRDLLQTAERLQFLFTPSAGFEELGFENGKEMVTGENMDDRNDPEEPTSTDGIDRKPDLSVMQSLFATANDSAEKAIYPFRPLKSRRMEIPSYLQRVAQDAGISDLTSFELAEALEDADPLKHLRDEFFYPKMKTLPHVDLSLVNPDDDSIYMCSNSLGLMPKRTKLLMDEQFEKWANMGVFGHFHEPFAWAHSDESVLDGIAKLVGAERCEVALMNSLTVNLHILLAAFYQPTPKRYKILIESKAFPSDHYAVESQIRMKGFSVEDSLICLEPRNGEDCIRNEDIISTIEEQGDSIAIIWLSGIHYYTGQLFDIRKITKAGHDKGCFVGWELAHAFANVPLSLHRWDVDFACWCTYKYSCSGAGGIGGFFIHKRFENDKRDRMLGWWAHKMETRFVMDNRMDLDSGAAGYRISNPPMMLVVPVAGFLQVISKTTIHDLRSKSVLLTGYLEYLINHFLSPSSLNRRTKRVDKRYPDVIRVTPVHLYNNFTDVHRFMRALLDSLSVVESDLEKQL